MYKKKELQLSYFSICEGKKLDDKIVTYFALKAGSTVGINEKIGLKYLYHMIKNKFLCIIYHISLTLTIAALP